ncbi:MAG: helix-turn-helix domain-containing protein [Saprospiraceae bacterium]|nr:helix-turn-helix domain-containing protein [Saprospiraceae bacterium]
MHTPAPLAFILFVFFFYSQSYYLMPRYLNRRDWHKFIVTTGMLYMGAEVVRIVFYLLFDLEDKPMTALFDRDSFIFGAPAVATLSFNASLIYYMLKVFVVQQSPIKSVAKNSRHTQKQKVMMSDECLLLKKAMLRELEDHEAYLNPKLSLRVLAESVQARDKQLSFLINHHLDTTFSHLINSYRVNRFKEEAINGQSRHLSIVGLAQNCGFSSKSSFYRVFKAHTGITPTRFIDSLDEASQQLDQTA